MASQFEEFSNAAAAVVREAGQSVVRVEGRKRLPSSGIIWPEGGYVLTANHTLEKDEGVRVGLEMGESLAATLVGRDPTTDLALIKVDGASSRTLQPESAENLGVGQFVFALGRPGHKIQASLGMISILGNEWRTQAGGTVDLFVQSGVEMLPGFSGGPLISSSGRLIGLNTSAVFRDQAATIPVKTLNRVVESLKTHGKVRTGYLGVGSQPVRLPEALVGDLKQETGLLITSVEPGSPADRGGLLLGDILIGLAGEPVRFPDDLVAALTGAQIGSDTSLRLVRAGQVTEKTVQIGERK